MQLEFGKWPGKMITNICNQNGICRKQAVFCYLLTCFSLWAFVSGLTLGRHIFVSAKKSRSTVIESLEENSVFISIFKNLGKITVSKDKDVVAFSQAISSKISLSIATFFSKIYWNGQVFAPNIVRNGPINKTKQNKAKLKMCTFFCKKNLKIGILSGTHRSK